MKTTKIIAGATLAATLFAGGVNAFAADGGVYQSKGEIKFKASTGVTPPVDPTDPDTEVTPEPTPNPGTNGPLSIDFASSFNFGEMEISSVDQVYNAAAQTVRLADGTTKDVANYVQVTDNRGTEKGWTLVVTQDGQFAAQSDNSRLLTGAEVSIKNIGTAPVSESGPAGVPAGTVTLIPGTATTIMDAKDGHGAGTHLAVFGDDATKADSVELSVPGKTAKIADTYETSFTWTLTDTVGNL